MALSDLSNSLKSETSMNSDPSHRTFCVRRHAAGLLLAGFGFGVALPSAFAAPPPPEQLITTPYVVFGYNDLGMHCMNGDYSEMLVLPPFNTLRAQILRRGTEPDMITSSGDVIVRYFTPTVTHAADKSNFWRYPTLGAIAPNMGVAGYGLRGTMGRTSGENDWNAVGIPMIPIEDSGRDNPYPLATIEVRDRNTSALLARTQAVVPVSTEMSCFLCHNTAGISTASDILKAHDRLHGTDLMAHRPVLCANCHADNALGLPGTPGVSNLSNAMHSAHASRMGQVNLAQTCYACHPGVRTQCQRDVHFANNVTCTNCHGDMAAVGNPARNPWVDEPKCSNCHSRANFTFEQPGKLYKQSVNHGSVHCAACHGSPHAITPTVTEVDNLQAVNLQGHTGTIDTCTVCHGPAGPPGSFFHKVDN